MKKYFPLSKLAFVVILLTGITSPLSNACAQGTAFTYQGQLLNNGVAANGNFNFTFALFNTNSTNGSQIGSTVTNLNVGVTNGLFVSTLDFGPVFTGNPTWLAVTVESNGGSDYAPLNPLQQLTPTPYAIYATTAGTANSVPGQNLTGTIPTGVLSGFQSANNYNAVGGGLGNQVTGTNATIAGGYENLAQGEGDFIGGGGNDGFNNIGGNATDGGASVIGGGVINSIGYEARHAFIGAGYGNTIASQAINSAIVGGHQNQIGYNSLGNFVGGGYGNVVSSNVSYSVITGGTANNIFPNADGSVVSGGIDNEIFGTVASFIGGGELNTNEGNYATIPGGYENLASGEYSFAAGQQAEALHNGAFVWADSQSGTFSSTGANQFDVRAGGGVSFVTGNAPMTLNGNSVLTNGQSNVTLQGTFTGSGAGLTGLPTSSASWSEAANLNTAVARNVGLDSTTGIAPGGGCFVVLASASFNYAYTNIAAVALNLSQNGTLIDSATGSTSQYNLSLSLSWVVPVSAPGATNTFATGLQVGASGFTMTSHNLTVMYIPSTNN